MTYETVQDFAVLASMSSGQSCPNNQCIYLFDHPAQDTQDLNMTQNIVLTIKDQTQV